MKAIILLIGLLFLPSYTNATGGGGPPGGKSEAEVICILEKTNTYDDDRRQCDDDKIECERHLPPVFGVSFCGLAFNNCNIAASTTFAVGREVCRQLFGGGN